MRIEKFRIISLLAITVLLLQACGASQPTKYYLLTSDRVTEASESSQQEVVIGIGPVVVPEYLDRKQIVTRTKANELVVSTYNQWAEPLGKSLSRVLSENIGAMVPTDRTILLPVKRSIRKALTLDYQVTISFSKFEKDANGEVVLNARWVLLTDDKKELLLRRSVYKEMPKTDDYAEMAASQSRLLTQFSQEIADAIKAFEAKK